MSEARATRTRSSADVRDPARRASSHAVGQPPKLDIKSSDFKGADLAKDLTPKVDAMASRHPSTALSPGGAILHASSRGRQSRRSLENARDAQPLSASFARAALFFERSVPATTLPLYLFQLVEQRAAGTSTHCGGGCCSTILIQGASLVSSCPPSGSSDPGGSDPGSSDPGSGTPPPACSAGQTECDGSSLKTCSSGAWQSATCSSLCKQAGYDVAVSCGANTSGKDVCFCDKLASLGVGDPCTQNSQCASGTCNGAWCTKSCSTIAQCAGKYGSGSNVNGFFNACMAAEAGQNYCFPRCLTNSDCAKYPGTTCVDAANTQGAPVKVCSA